MTFQFKKLSDLAVAPAKAHACDSGYDLVLVRKVKEENGVVLYDTDIAVQPPHDIYFDLVGRSSIFKTGYMLANNIGIIDQSYRSSIKVALVKINKDLPDLPLPARVVQIIPRHVIHLEPKEVDELDETARGEGGFGSTGSGVFSNVK